MTDQMMTGDMSGLQMLLLSDPNDLNPDESVFFMVDGRPANDVATAVVREFQALGYNVRPVNESQAIANQGHIEIHITIHGLRTNVTEGNHNGLASQALDSVVVELAG